jgi:hypothetical protein
VDANQLCVDCGGLCCQRAPGRYAPEELTRFGGAGVDGIQAMLEAGHSSITVSYIAVCDGRVAPLFTLAARGVGQGEVVLCTSSLRCSYLGRDSCMLTLAERPYECAMMVPNRQPSQCLMPDGQLMEELWLPHQDALRQVIELRSGRPWPDELQSQVDSAPAWDEYARGVQELIATLGLATDHDELIGVIERAWGLPERSIERSK